MGAVKENLKKIKRLRKSVRAVKAGLSEAKRPYDRARATYYLKKKKTHASDKVRIGFIAQCPGVWDKQIGVYEAAKSRADVEVFMFVVPEGDLYTYEIVPDYTDNYFCKEYPESIKLLDKDGNCLDLREYHLDYLFYQRPYDYRIPKMVGMQRMVKYVKCCYLPYFFNISVSFNSDILKNRCFDNMYFMFTDSEYTKSILEKKYSRSAKKKIRNIKYLGSPALEQCVNHKGEGGYITWSPRYANWQGGSTFLEYRDFFPEFVRKTGKKVIFRPHPGVFTTHLMTDEEWAVYLKELDDLGVITDTASPVDEIFEKTDILIADYSSVILNFFLTGKPVIYCENGIVFSEAFMGVKENSYVAHSWDEVEHFYEDIVSGNDSKKAGREKYIEENFGNMMGAADRIVDCICEDWKKF
jgi:hypothetical protein